MQMIPESLDKQIMKTPKINYDDYYKFIISLSILTFILGVLGATYTIYQKMTFSNIIGMISYFSIAVTSVFFFLKAGIKWKDNQEKLDLKLDAEVTMALLRCKKEASKYNDLTRAARNKPPRLKFLKILSPKVSNTNQLQKVHVNS